MAISYRGHSRGPHHEVVALAWSPGGSHIASAGALDNSLHTWSTRTGSKDRTYKHGAHVSAIAWASSGTIMVGDRSGIISLWRDPQSRVIDALQLRSAKPERCAMHQTSQETFWIDSPVRGRYKAWETQGIATIAPAPVGNLVFSASGFGGVSTSAGSWRIWDMKSHAEYCATRNSSYLTATWSPDGTRFACADGPEFTVHAAPGGAELFQFSRMIDPKKEDLRRCGIAWSPDGTKLATNTGILQIWDTASWQLIACCDDRGHVASVSWSPDSTRLAVASGLPPATLRVIHARTGEVIAEPVMAAAGDFIGPPAWAPLDDRIAYPDSRGVIHVIAVP